MRSTNSFRLFFRNNKIVQGGFLCRVKLETILACDGPPWMFIIFVFNAISHSRGLLKVVGWTTLVESIILPFSYENVEQTFQYDQKSQRDKLQEGKVWIGQMLREKEQNYSCYFNLRWKAEGSNAVFRDTIGVCGNAAKGTCEGFCGTSESTEKHNYCTLFFMQSLHPVFQFLWHFCWCCQEGLDICAREMTD